MKKFRITAYDVYIQEFAVLAESEKEALEKFKKGEGPYCSFPRPENSYENPPSKIDFILPVP